MSRYCKAPEQFARIVKWTSNLNTLNLENCCLSDGDLQKIFQASKGRSLSCLNLNGCEEVSGAGFMGTRSPEIIQSDSELHLNDKNDAKNTQFILPNTYLDSSIASLQKITKLQINRTLITDATILGNSVIAYCIFNFYRHDIQNIFFLCGFFV